MNYWLMKSEPSTFSIDDLASRSSQIEPWNGVRNYQARNFLKEMKKGDLAFFYHSSCEIPGVVGIVEIVKEAYPDPTAQDPKSQYYDAKSTVENPRWFMVDVRFKKKFDFIIKLEELRKYPQLNNMILLKKGSRLSVMPVTKEEWNFTIVLHKLKHQ